MPDAPSFDTLDDAAYQRALAVLLDVGTSIAKELKLASPDATLAQRAKAFEAVSLAVRRTILLSRHIAEAPPKPVRVPPSREEQRKQVIRAVDDQIDLKAKPADASALRIELLERVDSLDFDADLTRRSPDELIQELCRDLGLSNMPGLRTFRRRTPDDIAILCAQAAAAPGSGLPQWAAAASEFAAKQPIRLDVSPPPPPQHRRS